MRISTSLESISISKSGDSLAIKIRLGTSQHLEVYSKKKECLRKHSWTNTLPLSYWANVEINILIEKKEQYLELELEYHMYDYWEW